MASRVSNSASTRIAAAFMVVCLCVAGLSLFASPGFAEENSRKAADVADVPPNTIRVAYFGLGDYYSLAADGSVVSYDSAFLEKVSEYTGFAFEYVDCGTWEHALSMLENHEVDLVGTAQWNAEREAKYEYCLESYGYTVAELAALPENGFVYEDYEAIGSATIGCAEGYIRQSEMDAMFAQHDIAPQVKTYPGQQELENALLSGEVDIIAANSHTMRADWTVLEKFSYTSFYFVSWKGNEQLTNQLDDALIKIRLYDSSFDDSLGDRFFPVLVSSPFSKEELDLIDRHDTYTVHFDTESKPLIWLDADANEMKGVLVDVCGLLGKKTGIDFASQPLVDGVVPSDDLSVSYHTLRYDENGSAQQEPGQTHSILDESFYLYHRMGEQYDPGENEVYRVAVPVCRDGVYDYLSSEYPQYDLVACGSPTECMELLLAREVDLAFLGNYIASNYLVSKDIEDVDTIPTSAVTLGIGLQFHGENAEMLADIVDKGMGLTSSDEISSIKLNYALENTPDATPAYMLKHNMPTVIIAGTALFLLVSAVCILLVYSKFMRQQHRKLEEVDRMKMDFFSRMSHDMRTPMNGILGMAALSEGETDVAVLQQNMEKVKESGKYLLGLINDTLDLQKIETDRIVLELHVVKASSLVDGIASMVSPMAVQKNVDFKVTNENVELAMFLRLDPVRVKQIFVNLLANAIKFTPEGGSVEWVLACTKQEPGKAQLRFQVKDTGIGISKDFIEHELFTAYSQERNSAANASVGSGLGLAITKNLIEQMGGRIEVASELGQGSVFTVCLDVEIVSDEEALQSLSAGGRLAAGAKDVLNGRRILLCEDQPVNAEIVTRLLGKVGCSVTWVDNGAKGLEAFLSSEEGAFDAVIMDVRMPVMDGLEATRAMRALERKDAKRVPIIAMTANAFAEDVQHTREAGMDVHLSKPIDAAVLYRTLAAAIA